jgi:hypothetical protein
MENFTGGATNSVLRSCSSSLFGFDLLPCAGLHILDGLVNILLEHNVYRISSCLHQRMIRVKFYRIKKKNNVPKSFQAWEEDGNVFVYSSSQ